MLSIFSGRHITGRPASGLEIEGDVREPLTAHPDLAALLWQDPDSGRSEGR